MGTRTLVPLEEYLSTDYEPGCDYVDGELIDCNVGEKGHSKVQMRMAAFFYNQRAALGLHVFPELRMRLGPQNYELPVCNISLRTMSHSVFRTSG